MVKKKKPAKQKLTGAIDLFSVSYKLVLKNIKPFAVLLFIPFVAALTATLRAARHADTVADKAGNFSGLGISGFATYGLIGTGIIFLLAGVIFIFILQAMTYALELEAAEDREPKLNHLIDVGRKYWLRLIGLMLLIAFYVVVPVTLVVIVAFVITSILHFLTDIVAGITILFIVGFTLFVLQHYFMAPFAMIDKDMAIFDAMQESSRISKGNYASIWSILAVAFLFALTGNIAVIGPLVAFTLGALYSVAPAVRYTELKKIAK